jgi:hypothetical protein
MGETQVLYDTNVVITQYFKDHWNLTDAKVFYPNDVKENDYKTPTIDFSIRFGEPNYVSVGTPDSTLERSVNMVVAQISVPIAIGDARLLQIGDLVKAVFRKKDILINGVGGIARFLKPAKFTVLGETPDSMFYYGVVFAPFQRDAYV